MGPVCPMVWEGQGVVATGRKMLGATKPSESEPGTIRGDFCIDVGRNICHGSDSVESANHEIDLWFPESERNEWANHSHSWVYEKWSIMVVNNIPYTYILSHTFTGILKIV